jgi:hypothetical protein
MKCSKIKDLLPEYLKQELSTKDMKQVEKHILACKSCQTDLNELRVIDNLLNNVQPKVLLPVSEDDFVVQVRRKIRTQNAKLPRRSILPRLIPIFSAAAMVFILVIVYHSHSTKSVIDQKYLSSVKSEPINATYAFDNLDTTTQNQVSDMIVKEMAPDSLEYIELEVASNISTDELISSLSDNEKESFMQELINQYQENINSNTKGAETSPGGDNG